MTVRAVLIGLLGAATLCAFGFFNDMVIRQTFLIGNYLPISVYGALVAFLLVANPLLLRIYRGAALSGRELAVILALVLPACYVPGRGLIHYFTNVMVLPRHYERTDPSWQRYGVVDMAPDAMLVGAPPEYSEEDVVKPTDACRKLVDETGTGEPAAVAGRLLPVEMRPRMISAAAAGEDGPACELAVEALNVLVASTDVGLDEAFVRGQLPREAQRALAADRSQLDPRRRRRLNRHLLDAALKESVRSLSNTEEAAISDFVQGIGVGTRSVGVDRIPWRFWLRPLFRFWVPLILAMSVAVIGLALVVHKQWSEHEHLPYPIVTFAQSLMPQEGESRGGVFTSRPFLIAAGAVLVLHLNNYAFCWWPGYLIWIPTSFDFRSLTPLFPALQRGGDWAIMNPTIFFTAIGFAYFVSTDVSLSLGIAPFVFAVVAGTFAGYGVSLTGGGHISDKIEGFLFGGAFFGMFLVLAYTGRHYFRAVFRKSVFLRTSEDVGEPAAWGARAFLIGAFVFIAQLVSIGLEWQWAVLYTAGALVIFVVMSRVVAEAGTFFIHPWTYPGVLLWGFVGARAVGPQNMLIMFIVTTVLLIDPREAVMPFAVHALKLVDGRRIGLGRTATLGGVALAIGLAVAIPVTLYLQYDMGGIATGDGWTVNVPRFSYDAVVGVCTKLSAQGSLEGAGKARGFAWLATVSPNWPGLIAFVIAACLVLVFTAARLRFARWPLHPVMFITLGTWQSRALAVSFLIGCLVKTLANKYGGVGMYRRLKPVMIGLIAGDMLGGLIPMIVGALYYLLTGSPPVSFRVLPT